MKLKTYHCIILTCSIGQLIAETVTIEHDKTIAKYQNLIEKNRMADLSFPVIFNNPYMKFGEQEPQLKQGDEFQVELIRHRFLFGTCFSSNWDKQDHPDEIRYKKFITDHFNSVVSENDMKWYSIEKTKDQFNFEPADQFVRFAQDYRLAIRGHCMFWAREKFVQPWVIQIDDPRELTKQIEDHIRATVPRFKGKLECWDAMNEILDGSFFTDRLGKDAYVKIFKEIHKHDPDTPLFVNEYSILANEEKTGRYIALIKSLQASGVKLGGVGIQEHAAERFTWKPREKALDEQVEREADLSLSHDKVWATLDRIHAETGLPIHLTEISFKTSDEKAKARALELFYHIAFAHPAVEAFLLWGFWEKRHWLGADAALVDKDWKPNAAGEKLSELLRKKWKTELTLKSDGQNHLNFRGFRGDYRIKHIPSGYVWEASL